MLIRFGFEIEIQCPEPVPMLLALSTHTELKGRLIGLDFVRTPEESNAWTYVDRFGNRFTRILAPTGSTTLWSDCVVELDGNPDPQAPSAEQHAIAELPNDVLTFLMASRYCDSDNLVKDAWALFGQSPEGWLRVEAITQFVHDHVTFGYQFGRANKTASGGFSRKDRRLPRFCALVDRALPRHEHSGALCQRLSWRHWSSVFRRGRFLCLVRSVSGRALVYIRCPLQYP